MVSPSHNLAVRVLEGAKRRGLGDKIALRENDRYWSYEQLEEQVGRVSSALRSLRLARGERVAILMRDTLEAAASILGVIHAGAVAVPLSELARPSDIRTYLEHCGAVCAIVDGELEPALDEIRAQVPALREVLCVGSDASSRGAGERDFLSIVRAAAPAPVATAVSTTDMCLILYSAGASPEDLRGVPHSHAAPIAAYESFAQKFLALEEHDRVLSVTRLATAYGLGTGLFFPLIAGAESALVPEQPKSEVLFAAIERYQPTLLCATPSVYGQLARDVEQAGRDKPLAGLRVAVSAAEAMPEKLIPRIREALGTEVTVGYGLTEVFQFVLGGVTGSGWDGRPGTCGKPLPGIDSRVVGEDGAPLGADEIGTLQIRAASLFTGYWGGAVDDDPFAPDGWFTTRDRFLVDAGGVYHHCGRADDLFKVGGKWVSPVEVERALTAHEAVWECAVIGADDEDGLIKPFAFVVPNVGHDAGPALEAELREYVKQELAPYKYPRWIEFVKQLPRGPGGKLLRYKLRPKKRRRAETAHDT
ncbi:MAG TPA: benzoate-CoA ligase family protein [Kofleriaceae bacterium]|nr:benzoate-CoA ligase family protein [Kofleriaceae bacterium]